MLKIGEISEGKKQYMASGITNKCITFVVDYFPNEISEQWFKNRNTNPSECIIINADSHILAKITAEKYYNVKY